MKAELKVVHGACEVAGAAGLARLVAEVETLVVLRRRRMSRWRMISPTVASGW